MKNEKENKKKFKIIINNLIEVFSNFEYLLLGIITLVIIGYIFFYFTDLMLIRVYFGNNYMIIQFISQILITLLFGLFVPISTYKFFKFNSFSIKNNTISGTSTFLGILVAGCPACSITIASYLGIAGIFSFFPFSGLELKILSVPLLTYANYSLLKDLKVCKLNKKRKK